MINSSTEFNTAVLKDSRTFRAKLLYNNAEISCDIKNISVSKGACASFDVGSVFSSYMTADVCGLSTSLENKQITLQFGLLTNRANDTWEYLTIGVFNVTDVKTTAYGTTFTAVGNISAKTGDVPTLPQTQSIINLAIAIETKTGLTISFDSGISTSGIITESLVGLTCNEILKVIASVVGGYITESTNGNIVVKKYSIPSSRYSVGTDRVTALPTFNDNDVIIDGIKVVVQEAYEDEDGNTIPEVEYHSGTPRITCRNQYMTQALFSSFSTNILGYSYRPATVDIALGDPRLEPWDCLSVTDVNNNTYIVPCLTVTHIFDGGMITNVSADGSSLTGESSYQKGALTQQVERINAALLTAMDAIISRLTVDDLTADNLKANVIAAVNLYVEEEIGTDKIDAEAIDVTSLVAQQAFITALQAAIIDAGAITTEMLDAGTVSANVINAINLASTTIQSQLIGAGHIDVASLVAQQAFITAVQTELINAGAVTTSQLDAGTVSANIINAINLATSTINVSRIVYTDPNTGESYFVEITPYILANPQPTQAQYEANPTHYYIIVDGEYVQCTAETPYSSTERYYVENSSHTPTYEKVDGSVIEDLTISADKIQAGAISTDKLNIGAYMQFGYINDDPTKPRITIGNPNSFAVVIDPTQISFIYSNTQVAYMNNEVLVIPQSVMLKEMHVGHDNVSDRDLWSWTEHDGNLCLKWIGGNV